jgi:electron transport complex protein RnfE
MGGVFFTVLIMSSLCLSMMRHLIPKIMQLPIILLLLAFFATLVGLLLSTFYYEWHLLLDIYIPLLSVNCLIMVNAKENVLRLGLKNSMTQSLLIGLSIWGVLVMTGLIRDVMSGSLFGETKIDIFIMAPGAFLALGFVVAIIQFINIRTSKTAFHI